ncbi:MAG: TRAP transporter small permease [Candidatus Rokubacteria bacterium]|nr:TRAP transporter small permease [Candidatus Rokubacteria bacterium]
MRRLAALIGGLADAAGAVAAAATLALTLMVAAGVVARRVLSAPFLFVEELSGYAVLLIVFLGLAHTMKAGGHVRVEVLLERVRGRAGLVLRGAAVVLAGVWAVILMAGAIYQAHEYYTQDVLSFAYLQTPLWIPASLMVVGSTLLVLQCLALLLRVGGDA